MDQQTIVRLVQNSAQGDHASFRKLVELHQPFAYSIAFRILCSDYETEEVVQESFIKVWNHLKDFNFENRFSTWLYRIIVNLCYDRLKTGRNRKKHLEFGSDNNLLMKVSDGFDMETELNNKQQAAIIHSICEKLTPKQKIVFVLSELQDLNADEISYITGLSPAKIKSNLYCARREIRSKLIAIDKIKTSYAI